NTSNYTQQNDEDRVDEEQHSGRHAVDSMSRSVERGVCWTASATTNRLRKMSHPSQPNSRVRQSHALSTPRISVLIAIGIGIAAPVPAQSPVLKADSLVLERTGCFAICSQYQVRIAKLGEVLVRTGGRVR